MKKRCEKSGNCLRKTEKTSFGGNLLYDLKKNGQLYTMIIIPLAYLLVFKYYPMYGAQIAFKDYIITKGILGSSWIGFDHFERFLKNPQFWRYVVNTVYLSMYSLLVFFPLQIIFALGLNYVKTKFVKKAVQMVSYLPHFISVVIVVSMMNLLFDNRTGVLDRILEFVSGREVNILGDPAHFRSLYVWSGVWQNLGWSSILFVSALAGVDPSLHEAAMIDGANKWQRAWHVDIMSIIPTIAITFIMSFGNVLTVSFDKVFLMQNATNLKMSEVLSTYEYKIGIGGAFPAYSYSTAIGLTSAAVTFVLVMTVNRISKKLTETGLW